VKIGTKSGVDLLRNVTELVLGLELEDVNYINFSLKTLKKNILIFEADFKKSLKEQEQQN
jgi:predicted MarR family transcription regulator